MTAVTHSSSGSPGTAAVEECPLDRVPEAWSTLVPPTESGFYDTHAWHLANSELTGARSSAAIAADPQDPGRTPRAILPVYRYADPPGNPALNPVTLFAAAELDPAGWGPTTLIGTTIGYETVPLCREGDEAWWARAAEAVCAETDGTVACLYLDKPDIQRLARHLPGVPVLLSQARSVLPIRGATMPEHLAALTRKQRHRRVNETARLARTDRHASWRPLDPEDVPVYARLQLSTQRKYGDDSTMELELSMFEPYLEHPQLRDSAVIFVVEHEGTPVGYTLGFRHHDSLVLRAIGVDYDRATEGEYFSLLAHEPVRYCLEEGLSTIDFGLGSFRQKLVRGGALVPLYSLLLNAPAGWTAGHTHRQNTREAQRLLGETDGLLAAPVLETMRRIADTGAVGT